MYQTRKLKTMTNRRSIRPARIPTNRCPKEAHECIKFVYYCRKNRIPVIKVGNEGAQTGAMANKGYIETNTRDGHTWIYHDGKIIDHHTPLPGVIIQKFSNRPTGVSWFGVSIISCAIFIIGTFVGYIFGAAP